MTLQTEWLVWLKLSTLNGIRSACQLAPWAVSLALVGHVSSTDLAAMSLMEVFLNTFMEITWRSVGPTLSTLVSQSQAQGSLTVLRGWFCLSCLVMVLLCAAVSALCIAAKDILVYFGADISLAKAGVAYAYFIIPAVFLKGLSICVGTYIVSLQLVWAALIVDVLSLVINVFFAFMLIVGIPVSSMPAMHNAVKAAAVAWDVGSALSLVVAILVSYWIVWGRENRSINTLDFHYRNISPDLAQLESNYGNIDTDDDDDENDKNLIGDYERRILSSDIYSGLDSDRFASRERKQKRKNDIVKRAISVDNYGSAYSSGDDGSLSAVLKWIENPIRLRAFGQLALPNLIAGVCELLSIFVMSMVTIGLGGTALAVHNCTIALYECAFTILYGMYEITSVRVGFFVGRGDVDACKNVILISMISSAMWGLVVAAVGYFFRSEIGSLLSNDPDFISLFSTLSPIVWGSYSVFGVGSQLLAVLEGQGRAREQSIAFFVGTFVVSIPSYFLSYHYTNLGLLGLWGGLVAGYITTMIIAGIMLTQSDWDQIIESNKKMVHGRT